MLIPMGERTWTLIITKLKNTKHTNTIFLSIFISFILSFIISLPAKADLIPAQCVSGACNLNLRINDRDINKLFPDSYPGYRTRLNLAPLQVK